MGKIILLVVSLTIFLCSSEEGNVTKHPLIKKFDKDLDNKIFYTEASEQLQDEFCQYDVNQDGYIDEVEVEHIK